MTEEYHKLRSTDVEGSGEELIGKIAKLLFDPHIRYLKIELSSEGTLFFEGKIVIQY